ncbi:MAG: hypothetical protein ABI467_19675 [Kofleriaceae bacterium]
MIELLVETLAGYAYGLVKAQLARAVSSRFGAEHASRLRSAPPPRCERARNGNHALEIARALAHAPLDLGHELEVALQTRLGITVHDIADLVDSLVAALPAGQGRVATTMFSELNRDSVFDDRLGVEIATGWEFASAVIERRRFASSSLIARHRILWITWSDLAGAAGSEPVRGPVHSGGYIALVG